MQAAAIALRPGELSSDEISRAFHIATGGNPGALQHNIAWKYGVNFTIKGLPPDRYIIHVTGKFRDRVQTGSGGFGMDTYATYWSVYICDNYGQAYFIQTEGSPNAWRWHGGQLEVGDGRPNPNFPDPLTDAEMEFIKAMPLYDTEFASKFKRLKARVCDSSGKKSSSSADSGGGGGGESGGAAAEEDPSAVYGGRRKRRRTVKNRRRR